MILYCTLDPKYFELYFDIWEKQTSKIYPELRRHIALYNPTDEAKQKCVDHMIDFNDITEWFRKSYKKSFLLIKMVISTISLSTKHIRNTNQLCAC